MKTLFRLLAVMLALSAHAQAKPPLFEFHSDPWMNLHHLLYHAARNERLGDERLRGRVRLDPADAAPPLNDGEREAWNAALDTYAGYGRRDLLFDPVMSRLRQIIAGGEAAIAAGAKTDPLLRALVAAMPAYRRHLWPRHRAANLAFIARLQSALEAHGAVLADWLARAYESEWGTRPVRTDIVKYANWAGAYTGNSPNHIVMASDDARHDGLAALEILMHEAGHTQPLGRNIHAASTAAARRAGVEEDRLWHSYIFYASGKAIRQVAETHLPYAEANGLWSRGSMATHRRLLQMHFGAGSLEEQFERMHAAREEQSDE